MRIIHVVGARPNFMKVAPVLAAIGLKRFAEQILVHTGQHYDANMSDIFFTQLEIPRPDVCLGVGSGSHAVQTAQVMVEFEKVVQEHKPDVVMVYGDVNSTVAATLVSAKLGIQVAHVEAGLRSFDRRMPEELNRLVTDQLADLLLTPSADGDENLLREGIPAERIHRVGNVMIDTLVRLLPKARLPEILNLQDEFALVTLHRPSNVDDPAVFEKILTALIEISDACQIVFPVHPRTRHRMESFGMKLPEGGRFLLEEPLGYLECLALQRRARMVITDSGGIQEETTWLGVPCLTMRENTERPATVEVGTNILIGTNTERLKLEAGRVLAGKAKMGRVPELWDGRAGERIAELLARSHGAALAPIHKAA